MKSLCNNLATRAPLSTEKTLTVNTISVVNNIYRKSLSLIPRPTHEIAYRGLLAIHEYADTIYLGGNPHHEKE